mmetsp:Transcript_38543/g.114507  ORF Transcript_38543/g.114507 Transcript_38543/m.114507 type:complete len:227 (+) Transcript_38543:958-1638(+)
MRKHPQFSAVTETEAHVFFWKPLSAFDQWSPCRFEVDGQWYNCAEQYMMSEKAQLFGDMHTRAKILTELDPAVQKRLASAKGTLRNFDESTWERESLRIVTAGNRAKFEQNAELKAVLLATAGKLLVEASPMDAIWGIGLGWGSGGTGTRSRHVAGKEPTWTGVDARAGAAPPRSPIAGCLQAQGSGRGCSSVFGAVRAGSTYRSTIAAVFGEGVRLGPQVEPGRP